MSIRAGVWLSTAATTALVAYLFFPILRCPTQCIVDPIALAGPGLGHIALPDVHLNAWILAWVQKSFISDPTASVEKCWPVIQVCVLASKVA